jgi:UDP:flavonoid glycosyltransferase YjiC (YdhE family)
MAATGADVSFFNHGGKHLYRIEEAGLSSINLLPEISEDQDNRIMAIDQFRVPLGTQLPFTEQELIAQVEADLEALAQYKPDGVYCGLNISSMISVPYSKLPRVTMVPTTLCPAFYKKRLATFPNSMEKSFFLRHIVPGALKRRFFNSIMLKDIIKETAATFNIVRKHFGLPPIYNMIDFVKSDLILLPDLPELSGLPENELPDKYKYTGPIFYKMNHLPVPEEAKAVFNRPGLKVFCSLGSSGSAEMLREIIATLRSQKDFNVVCATTTILDPSELGLAKENFYAARYMPSHLVNEMADIAITHGGQGTIQTSVWSGTPTIGIGFQSEQQANIEGLVRAGMGIRLKIYDVTPQAILNAIRKIHNPVYKENARRMQQLVRRQDGVANSVRLMNELISQ